MWTAFVLRFHTGVWLVSLPVLHKKLVAYIKRKMIIVQWEEKHKRPFIVLFQKHPNEEHVIRGKQTQLCWSLISISKSQTVFKSSHLIKCVIAFLANHFSFTFHKLDRQIDRETDRQVRREESYNEHSNRLNLRKLPYVCYIPHHWLVQEGRQTLRTWGEYA